MKSGCIYALLHADGVLKVGTTTDFRTRLRGLKQIHRSPVVAYVKSPRIEEIFYRVEGQILKRVRNIFPSRLNAEWFYCHDFGIVRNLVHQFHRRYGNNETGWSFKTLDCRQTRTKEKL